MFKDGVLVVPKINIWTCCRSVAVDTCTTDCFQPENIFLQEECDDYHVKIGDFGLVKVDVKVEDETQGTVSSGDVYFFECFVI